LKQEKINDLLLIIISCLGTILGLISIVEFIIFHYNITQLGIVDMVDFKFMFQPVNIVLNEWVEIFILLLPFSVINFLKFQDNKILRSISIFSIIISILCILISFSRGAYLSLLIFFILASRLLIMFHVINIKRIISLNIAVILISLYFALPYYVPVLTTASIFKTTSQKRSYEGRKDIYSTGIAIFKDNKILGIGANNFAIVNNTYQEKKIDTGFTSRVNNLILQILIEKGIIGFILYFILFGFVIICSF
jgi:O-antigen ligase